MNVLTKGSITLNSIIKIFKNKLSLIRREVKVYDRNQTDLQM